MKSTVITLRLTDEELKMLDRIKLSSVRGDLSRSELLRLLLHREFRRRPDKPPPSPTPTTPRSDAVDRKPYYTSHPTTKDLTPSIPPV